MRVSENFLTILVYFLISYGKKASGVARLPIGKCYLKNFESIFNIIPFLSSPKNQI